MRTKEPSTGIIYVRHGVTDFPLDRIYCDAVEDPPLNATGLAQAQSAAGLLRPHPVVRIVASPAARTRMTAEAIAAATGAEVTFEEALRERRFGVWEGLYFHEIERDYAEDYRRWKRDQAGFKPAGGESVYNLRDRVGPVVEALAARHRGELVVVVSHVGPIRVLACEAVGVPLTHYRQLSVDYASLTRIDYGGRQNNFIYLNYKEAIR